jgi:hypothetical protein
MSNTEGFHFRGRLRDEIVSAQGVRAGLVREKLIFVVGALGLGTVSKGWLDSPALLLLVPVVASIFDMYIAGEDFHVKRIGGFLGATVDDASREEAAWEALAELNPDRFSQVANPGSSLLAIGGAALVVWKPTVQMWLWLNVSLVATTTIWTLSHIHNRRIRREARRQVTMIRSPTNAGIESLSRPLV